MKLQIIGAGVLGQATGKGFSRLGHEVTFVDSDPKVLDGLARELFYTFSGPISGTDVYFICTPERAVEEVVSEVVGVLRKHVGPHNIPVVIRSTVPPGTARRLRGELHRPILSNPEFLREAVAEFDFLNPPGIIIGVDPPDHNCVARMRELYEPFRKPLHFVNTITAELTKLAVNAYLACQISYWNQVKLLADKLGVNSQEVGMLACFGDGRVSPYGSRMHGKAYGGKCLPKDLRQLLLLSGEWLVDNSLLDAIAHVNRVYGGEG